MSQSITPYKFVQEVFLRQEGVLLDFHPSDDKYKEVLATANHVLTELQKEEDWSWLRKQIILGSMHTHHTIPEFRMPKWVFRPSVWEGDGVRLHSVHRHHHLHNIHCRRDNICWDNYIRVPWVQHGFINEQHLDGTMKFGRDVEHDNSLVATWQGNIVTFNRLPYRHEQSRVAVTDVQAEIEQFDMNNESDEYKDSPLLHDIPDIHYVIIRTASLRSQYSPPASNLTVPLADEAQKLLSAMRQNEKEHTRPSIMPTFRPEYLEVW
jgi:hypothetical protein